MIVEQMDKLALYRSRSRDWWASGQREACIRDLISVEILARALINMISLYGQEAPENGQST
jgi:hypothetical protein